MIDRLQAFLQKPMVERSGLEEFVGCLIILLVLALIGLIGWLVDVAEQKWRRRKEEK